MNGLATQSLVRGDEGEGDQVPISPPPYPSPVEGEDIILGRFQKFLVKIYKAWRSVIVRFVETFWISTSLNSVSNAENISALISQEKDEPVQNLIPTILGTIIVELASTISSFAEIVANTGQEEVASASRIISVKNVEIDKAMPNVKVQSLNKVQIPNLKYI